MISLIEMGRQSSKESHLKGSTKENKADFTYVAVVFYKLNQETQGKKGARKFAYDAIIKEAQVKHDSQLVKTLSSVFRNQSQLCTAHQGPSSPMMKVEALMLDMILLLGDMRAPVTCREWLELMNLLVHGTMMQEEIKEWTSKHLPDQSDVNDDKDITSWTKVLE